MLKVEGINQYYGGSHILRNLGFEAKLGEVTVVLGRNGVGKTTLLKSLMGVVPVKAGRVMLGGAEITAKTRAHAKELFEQHRRSVARPR
jgi:urea transport system ATP-binding protein